MSNSQNVLYGAYGANQDPEMLWAITGNAHLVGKLAIFNDVELCIQRLDQIPDVVAPTAPVALSPKAIIGNSWGKSSAFETYVIRPAEGGQVTGRVYELTQLERALIADWELIEFGWYQEMVISAAIEDGTTVSVHTEGLSNGSSVDRVVDGLDYPTYLNEPTKMFTIATHAREDFLARQD